MNARILIQTHPIAGRNDRMTLHKKMTKTTTTSERRKESVRRRETMGPIGAQVTNGAFLSMLLLALVLIPEARSEQQTTASNWPHSQQSSSTKLINASSQSKLSANQNPDNQSSSGLNPTSESNSFRAHQEPARSQSNEKGESAGCVFVSKPKPNPNPIHHST